MIADSRLTTQYNVQQLEDNLNNYFIFSRYDSDDNTKHMGLVGLCSRTSKLVDNLTNIETSCFRIKEKMIDGLMETYIQGIIIKLTEYQINVAFVYIRRKPKKEDILILKEKCEGCIMILGDLNLNPANVSEKKSLELLCGKEKKDIP